MSLLNLNDDCLRLIGEILPLLDQFSYSHVCVRLQQIVENIWRHNSQKINLREDQLRYFDEHEEDFHRYMSCQSDKVEHLEFTDMTVKRLRTLSDLSFPKVQSLSVCLHYAEESKEQDQAPKLIKTLFPQLRKLEITASITGHNLWDLKSLEELHLFACEDLRTKYFKKIFSTLRLKSLTLLYNGYNTNLDARIAAIADCSTLEHIQIDDHHLFSIIEELSKLKRLRKLTVYTRDYDVYFLEEIVKIHGSAMDTMIFDDVFWSEDQHCNNVQKMNNLRCLIFHEDTIEAAQLLAIGKKIGNSLEEFHFIKSKVDVRAQEKTLEGIFDFLWHCKNLKLLQISKTADVNLAFVERLAKLICAQRDVGRKTPLLLYCSQTQLTMEDLETLQLPALLQVTLEEPSIELPGCRFIQCEWRNDND